MKCRDVRDRMSDHLDDALDAREGQALASHIRSCASCGAAWESLRVAVEAVRSLPRFKPAESVAFGVLNRIEVEQRGPGLALLFRPAWMARPLIFPSLAPAALVLASVLAGVVALHNEPSAVVELPAAPREQRFAAYGTESNPVFPSADVSVPRVRARREIAREAMADWPEGSLLFETVIGRDGNVADVRLLEGEPGRGAAVAEALRGEQFEPARRHGRPVAVSVYRLISHMEVRASIT
jgi:anti-sigma factor RsiW